MVRRKKKPAKVKQPKTKYFLWLIKNLFFAGIAALIIKMVVYPFGEDNTLTHRIYRDMRKISQLPFSTTLEQRYTAVLESTYTYFMLIKNNTQENAVILYPEYESFFPENEKHVFQHPGISNKMWVIRFLYPRKIINPSELESSPYKDKISDVAIVNGRGREFLPYKLTEDAKYGVAPINLTEEELQNLNIINQE